MVCVDEIESMNDKRHTRVRIGRKPEMISELVFPVASKVQQHEIEKYMLEWERQHGPVDLTKMYTSRLSFDERVFLAEADPKRFFDGLPTFAQDYIRINTRRAAELGKLDDVGDTYIYLFTKGLMSPRDDGRNA